MRPNVLLVTLDQFRGDCLSTAGHPVVRTPHLDRLAATGVRFARHYSQASPCGPGRASLYTGMYQMNHRVVANGSPLDAGLDNIALAARRAGYSPVLFGYTDQTVDPRVTTDPGDLRLGTYEGILPGFDAVLDLSGDHAPWLEWLAGHGHAPGGAVAALASERERDASLSLSAFMTERFLSWLPAQRGTGGWFAHLSYLRPHPPYSAAGHWSRAYPPGGTGEPIAPVEDPERFHALMLELDETRAPAGAALAEMRAQYFGMVSEVDDQLGRVLDALEASGERGDTLVVVTSDHAELLGDHGLKEKVGYFETSQHVVCIVSDPSRPGAHGSVVDRFTENVDIMPTLCEAMGAEVPLQCDGFPLTPFLAGAEPPSWRDAAHWEYDWRFALVQMGADVPWPWRRSLEKQNLCVHRTEGIAYVQFADGRHLAFDLEADPTWRTRCTDTDRVLDAARALLAWRMQMADRRTAGFLAERGGIGRWPPGVPWRE